MSEVEPVKFIKKRKGAPSGLRKKDSDLNEPHASTSSIATEQPAAESEVVVATKRAISSHLVQGTSGISRKRKEKDSKLIYSDSEEEGEDGGGGAKKEAYGVRYSATTQRERRRSSSPPAEVSAESIKAQLATKGAGTGKEDVKKDDGLYRGEKAQGHQLPKAFGPIKGGPGNVRQITLVDYQPDVCKDYKETGFCGFGDSCKFLHDRGDYLHGWQLDNSFLSSSAAAGSFLSKQQARENGGGDDQVEDDVEELPFACLICRKPFGKDPVVTLCGHYFDSACAIKRFAKTGKCIACGASTNGVFNRATKLIDKMKEREKLLQEAKEQEMEFEDDEGGIEIEGLEEDSSNKRRADQEEEEEEIYEDEAPRPKKRRPIVEIM